MKRYILVSDTNVIGGVRWYVVDLQTNSVVHKGSYGPMRAIMEALNNQTEMAL